MTKKYEEVTMDLMRRVDQLSEEVKYVLGIFTRYYRVRRYRKFNQGI